MKTITLTSKDLAEKIVESFRVCEKGFKRQEEHWTFCRAIWEIVGQEMSEEICAMAKEMLNEK